jgi:sec-independent protein translocase protein TatC
MSKPKNSEMTFWDHLDDLRNTLFRIVGFVGIASLVFFAFMRDIFNQIILAPSRNDFFLYQWFNEVGKKVPYFPEFISGTFNVKVININLASQFLVHLTSSLCYLSIFFVC